MDMYFRLDISDQVMKFIETSPLLGAHEFDINLSWHNLTVTAKRKHIEADSTGSLFRRCFARKTEEEVIILDNVSGRIRSGSLVAVLGSSGCGKTTLLAAVSKRLKGNIKGKVLLANRPVQRSLLTKISGFVPQKDIAFTSLTAKEHLLFMSHMRLDRELCLGDRIAWIQTLLADLNLLGCEQTQLSAMSGGERRRLSLAVELLTDPPMLFCDEPTTGLDSYNASTVVEKLRHLATRGKVVLCSIHQPTSDVLNCFHQVILMAGGRMAFQGTLAQAYQFFASQGYKCPVAYNPAEFYIHKLSVIPGKEEDSLTRISRLCEAFDSHERQQELNTSVPQIEIIRNSLSEIANDFEKYVIIRKPYWHTQVYWLIWRSALISFRNKNTHAVRILLFLVTSFFLSLCFLNTETETQRGVQDVRGILYLISSEIFFTRAYSVFDTFPQEIPVFLREASLYPASAYYLSKMLTLIPRAVTESLIYFAITFTIVKFSNGGAETFFMMAIPIVISANSAAAYGCMLSALFEKPETAALLAVPFDIISFIMAGIFYNVRALPDTVIWMKYLSQFYYSNEALAVLQWEHVHFIECPDDPNMPCLKNGDQVLLEYGFDCKNLPRDLMALAVFYIGLHLIGFLSVWRRSKRQAIY
nr:ABCG transpoter Brown [Hymenopus coronatus]